MHNGSDDSPEERTWDSCVQSATEIIENAQKAHIMGAMPDQQSAMILNAIVALLLGIGDSLEDIKNNTPNILDRDG
jgi:hypothetical protein